MFDNTFHETDAQISAWLEQGQSTAVLSECESYRYALFRPLEGGSGLAVFCMLNPSTANATLDDPTIRRCRGFAAAWGKAGFLVVNLYALRSPNPQVLKNHPDPIGPANRQWLQAAAKLGGEVVCAWGAHANSDIASQTAELFLAAGGRPVCLGITKAGAPKHPLYIKSDTPLGVWKPLA